MWSTTILTALCSSGSYILSITQPVVVYYLGRGWVAIAKYPHVGPPFVAGETNEIKAGHRLQSSDISRTRQHIESAVGFAVGKPHRIVKIGVRDEFYVAIVLEMRAGVS